MPWPRPASSPISCAGLPSALWSVRLMLQGDSVSYDSEPASSRLREQATHIAPRLLTQEPSTPGYFDVLANSINIMQDYITRARLAGDPPHVLLVPRLGHIGLMEYNRAKEAIAEGRLCVEQALPMLKRFL